MNKARIVRRTQVCGDITYIIQQKHFLFRFWCDADTEYGTALYSTLEDAQKNLCYYDGTKSHDEVIGDFAYALDQMKADHHVHRTDIDSPPISLEYDGISHYFSQVNDRRSNSKYTLTPDDLSSTSWAIHTDAPL